jgi:hypothetical protein
MAVAQRSASPPSSSGGARDRPPFEAPLRTAMASASGRTPHVVVERGRERPVSSAARPRRILEHPTGDVANPVTRAPCASGADECAWWQQV